MASPLAATAQQMGSDAPVAHTALGDLRGVFRHGVAAFNGVPYAAPPIGELRFAPAAPVRPWSGERDATRHGSIAPQLPPRLSVSSDATASPLRRRPKITESRDVARLIPSMREIPARASVR